MEGYGEIEETILSYSNLGKEAGKLFNMPCCITYTWIWKYGPGSFSHVEDVLIYQTLGDMGILFQELSGRVTEFWLCLVEPRNIFGAACHFGSVF